MIAARARALLSRWERLWETPGLAQSIDLVSNPLLRSTLGRCFPTQRRIELNPRVLKSRGRAFAQILCHEAAHFAVHQAKGRNARPHGKEWATLVRAAGFAPTTGSRICVLMAIRRKRPGHYRYEHRCLVCHTIRFANQPIRNWRCASCAAAGLPGEMRITRRPEA